MAQKMLTFSFDDGVLQDRRMIELLNRYGMKATFNLNSALLGQENELHAGDIRVAHTKNKPEDVRAVYDGHEVAVHTLTHPLLPAITDDQEIIRQVEQDRLRLSDLCGYEVVGMAYPCGGKNCDERVSELVKNNTGVKYARTIVSTFSFAPQKELYRFDPSVYFFREMDEMFRMGEEFLRMKPQTPQIFYVWGHAYELDIYDDWARFEDFLRMMSGKPDIVYCTNREALLQQ